MKKAFGIPLESHARFDETFGSRLFTRDAGHANLTYFSPGAMPPGGGGGGASRLNCVWGGARVFERRGSGVGEFAPRKSEDVSSSSLAEGNSPGEVSIEGETFLSAYRLARDGAILLASFHSSRIVALPSRDVEKILRSFVSGGSGTEDGVPSERLTPTARDACGRLAVGSIIVTTRDASGYGGRGRTNACPPLAVERLASGALRIEWRYRRGSEGAPRAVAEALLTRLRRHREDAGV
jgi:tRNA (cytosine34-C5)-methyltransferase